MIWAELSARLYGHRIDRAQDSQCDSKGNNRAGKNQNTHITVGNVANVEKHGRIRIQFIPV